MELPNLSHLVLHTAAPSDEDDEFPRRSSLDELLDSHLKKRRKLLEQRNGTRKTLVPHVPESDPSPQLSDGWALKTSDNKIAVLFHCSTPCQTYSVVGLKEHREGDTLEPKTVLARNHDAMNSLLVQWFEKIVLRPANGTKRV